MTSACNYLCIEHYDKNDSVFKNICHVNIEEYIVNKNFNYYYSKDEYNTIHEIHKDDVVLFSICFENSDNDSKKCVCVIMYKNCMKIRENIYRNNGNDSLYIEYYSKDRIKNKKSSTNIIVRYYKNKHKSQDFSQIYYKTKKIIFY